MDIKKILSDHVEWLNGPGGTRADLSWANLRGADIRRADLRWADLRETNLSEAKLSDADLRDADLSGADLSGANLRGTDLRLSDLSEANLRDVDLRRADLRDADLRGADLDGADLRQTIGNGTRIKTLLIGKYIITWHADVVCIGCNRRTLTEWEKLDESEIPEDDLELWRANKGWIIETVKRFPAE